MASTAPAAADPTCRRCSGRGWHYLEGGADEWPLEVDCAVCADLDDDDAPDDDGGMWNDDVAESAPDDASRWAAVSAIYHAA